MRTRLPDFRCPQGQARGTEFTFESEMRCLVACVDGCSLWQLLAVPAIPSMACLTTAACRMVLPCAGQQLSGLPGPDWYDFHYRHLQIFQPGLGFHRRFA